MHEPGTTVTAPRIACLTSETAELCFALGLGDQVVGRSAFCTRPDAVKRVPVVSGFTEVRLDRLAEVAPDIVLAFSDMQADACRQLVAAGHTVLALNQRTLAETLQAIRWVGGLLDRRDAAESLVGAMQRRIDEVRSRAEELPVVPRVYFEEWDAPLIAGIGWVSELITLAGGVDVFSHLADRRSAPERVVESADVVAAAPDIMLASWCGKPFRPEQVRARPGWEAIPAVRDGAMYPLPGEEVLAPGLSLVDGLERIHRIVAEWAAKRGT
ncbi:MAG: cobalamin-binding protein [Deltaproteobacteria bacterium]|nr:MAG: cobalamin-binding protein [Deltaproteobacteria bacterium]